MAKRMRGVAAALVVGLGMGLLGAPAEAICVKDGEPAKAFTLPDVDGRQVSLQEHEGKVVLVVFWASWCSRCREELAYLKDLSSRFSDEVVVLAINQETEHAEPGAVAVLKQEIGEMGVEFPVLLDSELEVWGSYCVNALPTSIVIGRDGRVAFAEPNYYWASQDHLVAALTEQGVLLK